ncbi:GtrA family protein [Paracoccus benzoatiresistens]|uniref:GtrA family protein n=1 Tax=Paracoccus benzoatiresistens TaxID=2997341 RepID=A0ABT4JB98_9RHOB|nr:GtrA family protein [Paracoccus sp. EF6]MCZ0963746.1 GtrA family protein [Paracoccus sp. EF6]
MTIAFRYVLFAIVSTLVNFGTQELVIGVAPLAISILAGTAAGFAVKYVLDKKWIFQDCYTGPGHEARKITLYALFSVLTTAVFWGFEITFWLVWQTDLAKYAGGVIGLAIGYLAKFALDRRFVFLTAAA